MILSDQEILAAMDRGEIRIEPFSLDQLGGNSYDVRLSSTLRVHTTITTVDAAMNGIGTNKDLDVGDELRAILYDHSRIALDEDLDMKVEPGTIDVEIPDNGILLLPGIVYLGSTVEYTETHRHVPYLDGRSSVGRLGVSIHVTAGRGDVGFCNHWTMEIWVVQPVRIYPHVRIGQLTYHSVLGDVTRGYAAKPGTTYGTLPRNPLPQPSRIWQSFLSNTKERSP
jgi:dCTP deaminase